MLQKNNLLIVGKDISGHYAGLAKGFKMNNYQCDFILIPNPMSYAKIDCPNFLFSKIYYFLSCQMDKKVHNFKFLIFYILHRLVSLIMPLWVILRYKKIYFIGGIDFSRTKFEFQLYKIFNVKSFISFHGSDLRPMYLNGIFLKSHEKKFLKNLALQTKLQKKTIERKEYLSDYILASPSDHQFLSRSDVINITKLGNIIDEERILRIKKYKGSKKITVNKNITLLHCPSEFTAKGSLKIIEIVNEIKNKYPFIELMLKQNISNTEVISLMSNSDIIIDSLWNSSPAGAFPAEASFLGKPVIIGSYFAKIKDKIYKDKNDLPPYIFVLPDNFKKALEKLIIDESHRKDIGKKLRSHFIKYSSQRKIAKKYEKIFENGPSSKYLFNPKKIQYIYGYGIDKIKLKEMLKSYINANDSSALYLNHDIDLKNKIMAFVYDDN